MLPEIWFASACLVAFFIAAVCAGCNLEVTSELFLVKPILSIEVFQSNHIVLYVC